MKMVFSKNRCATILTQSLAQFLLVGLLTLCLTGCFSNKQNIETQGYRLPLPTNNEAALIDGRALTLSTLLNIRSTLRNPSTEIAYWVGIASFALLNATRSQGKEIHFLTALDLARYAVQDLSYEQVSDKLQEAFPSLKARPTPEVIREEFERLLKQSHIQKNTWILSQI